MELDWGKLIRLIEDQLAPNLALDIAETRLYYYLLRHSRLIGKREVLISVEQLRKKLNCSKTLVKSRLKTLQQKGIIEVVRKGWSGTRLRVLLPKEISGALLEEEHEHIDIENIDFFNDPKYRSSIFERENGKCFYCLRLLSDEDYGLDHVTPQTDEGGDSYRNVVAACHSCNSSKGSRTAENHIRNLYQRRIVSDEVLEDRIDRLNKLKKGILKPILDE